MLLASVQPREQNEVGSTGLLPLHSLNADDLRPSGCWAA